MTGPVNITNPTEPFNLNNNEEAISIEVTTCCNHSCPHCFARAGMSGYTSLPLNLVKDIIGEGYSAGYRSLHITGGEPLLWKDLFKALDYAFGAGYRSVLINTNGTFLNADITRKIAAYNGCSISISLDGDEALHNKIRGKGSYQKTISGIEKVLDAGIELIIFTIARKSLLKLLPHFVDDLYTRFPGIAYLTLIQLFSIAGDAIVLSEEFLAPDDFIKMVQTVAFLNLYGHWTIFKDNPLSNVVSKMIGMPWAPQSKPLYRSGDLIVMANRNIGISHSCRSSLGQYQPGMIRKVLASKAYRAAMAPDKEICPACEYSEACIEEGMIRPSEKHVDMLPEVPYCKRVLNRIST